MSRTRALGRGAAVSGAVELDEEVEVRPDDEAGEEVAIAFVTAAVLGIGVVI